MEPTVTKDLISSYLRKFLITLVITIGLLFILDGGYMLGLIFNSQAIGGLFKNSLNWASCQDTCLFFGTALIIHIIFAITLLFNLLGQLKNPTYSVTYLQQLWKKFFRWEITIIVIAVLFSIFTFFTFNI